MRIASSILSACRGGFSKNFIRRISSDTNFIKNVVGMSTQTANADYKNKPMLILGDSQTISYDQMNILSGQIAKCLNTKYNISKGDFVLCRTSKNFQAVAIYFAVLRLGAIYIPLNPAYTSRETTHFDAKPKLFITSAFKSDSNFLDFVPKIQDEVKIAQESLDMDPALEVENVLNSDIATMIYTSGTTGTPKGAMISHGALSSNAEASADHWRFVSDDVQLHTLPFYHIHGMFISFNCSLLTKSASIFLPNFSVPDVIKWLPKSTVFMGVPSYYHRLLESPNFGSDLLTNFRLFVSGSAPLSPSTYSEFQERAQVAILERYGMTEGLVITSNPYEEDLRVPGSVGQPISNVRISSEGLIEVKSPALFSGYWQLPEKTKNEFTVDGYFITGDIGEFDEKGNLQILGRQKELIISGGLNVYPKEVEHILDSNEQIKESAIIGVPHLDYGEAVVAVCVLTPENRHLANKDETHEKISKTLRNHLRAELAGYKIPKQFIFVEELPRNFLGKLQKHVLKEQYKHLFTQKTSHSEAV